MKINYQTYSMHVISLIARFYTKSKFTKQLLSKKKKKKKQFLKKKKKNNPVGHNYASPKKI